MNSVIAVFVIPGVSHIAMLVPLLRYFGEQGYAVRVYTASFIASHVEKAGAELVCLDDLYDQLEGDPYTRATSPYAMLELVKLMDERFGEELRTHPPALALVDAHTVWGRLLAGKYEIPVIISSTTMIMNPLTMKKYFRYYERSVQIMEEGDLDNKLEELTRDGFPKRDISSLYSVGEKENCIVYVSKELQPCADRMDISHVFFMGYADEFKGIPVRRSSSRPLIFISMGTSFLNTGFVFRNCVTAFKDRTELDVVMAVSSEEIVKHLGELPGHIRALPFVEQKEILAITAKADVVICHGGLGTVRESLLAGVPMIICPRAFDQEGNAKRVEELGAGITLDNNRPETLRRAVRLMLSVPSYRENSFRIGETLRKSGNVEEAGRWILSCLPHTEKISGQSEILL
ncbi:glycosyltransferase [Oribacterium sp. NK2B42]|uniref:glycosyltransferase n=1 Tax=Oribacterium sp. NK2B42 TaxID=689781 RepID=UPI000418E4A3|nr:nucleotide disphospho-sugar-binding domain-containing protein [Oribacterium sp. NK2B42]